ncbi:MAG: outer membrane lipoprotein carrier protein LolA [Deltaproteobacteria bacterium]|nr:outer membrane lipoprotein carrier protein LolA [Deltaproteobacteria bacterium]
MKTKIFFFLLPLLLLLGPLAAAGADNPEDVMKKVQAEYDKSGAFQARFQQESSIKAMQQTDTAAGWMYFMKPSRMRWQYEIPAEQKKEVVSDGRLVWMYMPQDALVMVYKLDQVLRSDLVMRFFSGIGQFQKDFTISWKQPPKAGESFIIDLFPKKEQAELKRLTLTINPKTYLVDKLEFANAMGEETRFAFSQMKLNVKLGADFFSFTPPPGVQVVRETPGS